ncbi:TPA: dATP/dGTP pyrophosphohydrolase domain-containing protein [Salmonella enterica subsp. enterica serovar Poona]|nr:DUF550 domain-containing protein [Salmonella enterica]
MTTITKEFTKEQLIAKAQEQIAFCRDTKITGEGRTHVNQCSALFEIALASLDAKPIGAFHIADQQVEGTSDYIKDGEWPIDNGIIEVYAVQPASERERIRREHAEWSDKTFGDVGPVGPLKHLSKEALEAAAEPDDLSEWADMQFLLWDAQRRAGITDEQITQAMVDKLKVNKQREWPEPKDGEPRLHIKEQPAPVVPEECPAELPYAQVKAAADLYALCWQSGEVVTYTPDPEKATIWLNNYSGTCVQEYVKLERLQEALSGYSPVIPDDLRRATMLQANQRDLSQPVDPQVAEYEQIMLQAGNSPVTPDGWINCSERMPDDKQYVWFFGESRGFAGRDTFEGYYDWSRNKWWAVTDIGEEPASKVTHWMPLPEPPQQ